MKTLTSEITHEVTQKRMKKNAHAFIQSAKKGTTSAVMKCPNCKSTDVMEFTQHYEGTGDLGPDILVWWVCDTCGAQIKAWYVVDEIAEVILPNPGKDQDKYDLTE